MTAGNCPLPPGLARRFPVLIITHVMEVTAVTRSAEAIRDVLHANDLHTVVASSLEDGETAISLQLHYPGLGSVQEST